MQLQFIKYSECNLNRFNREDNTKHVNDKDYYIIAYCFR